MHATEIIVEIETTFRGRELIVSVLAEAEYEPGRADRSGLHPRDPWSNYQPAEMRKVNLAIESVVDAVTGDEVPLTATGMEDVLRHLRTNKSCWGRIAQLAEEAVDQAELV